MATRAQKRWSGRLRTAGALVALLGGVAALDALIDLASPETPFSPLARTGAPAWIGALLLAAGAALFWLGRRWR